ncbi:MAG: dinitrogenase iron-molybdenum cofactor biosynthesis protein [Anaerolineales bacterium]|nr:dinitrogenase iron-molybdenum cofactor biosynthesis protein [Anaerolineales bacterium]
MKIAAVTDDGQTISQHFGRAKYYTVLTIEEGKIAAREQREKLGHTHFASPQGEHSEEQDPRGHGFAPAEQDRHFRMAEAIRDCQFLLARGMGAGAYYSMEQVGIKPIITDIINIDEAALEAAQGVIVDHKEKLH